MATTGQIGTVSLDHGSRDIRMRSHGGSNRKRTWSLNMIRWKEQKTKKQCGTQMNKRNKEQSMNKTIQCTKCDATDSRRFQCLNQVDPQIKGELYAKHFKARTKTKNRSCNKSKPNKIKTNIQWYNEKIAGSPLNKNEKEYIRTSVWKEVKRKTIKII